MPRIANPPGVGPIAHSQPSKISALVLVFRIVRWTVYACALIVLILLLHKPAPPVVSTTPEAAARAEQKFQDVQQSVAQGQPATLRMTETELNSYLASHLVLPANNNAVSGAANAAPSGTPDAAPNSDQPTMDDVEHMRSNVKDVKVQLVDDHVRAYVVYDVHGKDVTLQLVGKLGADNGFLRFEPVSGPVGYAPDPPRDSGSGRAEDDGVARESRKAETAVRHLGSEN
jgi:hypothetical protein